MSAVSSTESAPDVGADEFAQRGFLRRHGAALAGGVATLALMGLVVTLFWRQDEAPPPRQIREFTVVKIVQPPPLQPAPPPEQKMIEQPKMTEPPIKPEPDKPIEKPKELPKESKADEPPPGPLSVAAKAEGPGDLFNLGGNPNGRGLLGNDSGPGGGPFGWYAAIVQQQIEAALRANPRTRSAVLEVQVRLWADATGRITRVELAPSTGDAEIDAALRNEVLGGLVLREPPPKNMPMPVVARITERRSSANETASGGRAG
jgi:hypothetical protein